MVVSGCDRYGSNLVAGIVIIKSNSPAVAMQVQEEVRYNQRESEWLVRV
jgi:hypothetical protein